MQASTKQIEFLHDLVARIHEQDLPQELSDLVKVWKKGDRMDLLTKDQAAVAIACFLYVETVAKRGYIVERNGVVEFSHSISPNYCPFEIVY